MKDIVLSKIRPFLVIQLNHWMLAPIVQFLIIIWSKMIEADAIYSFPYLFWLSESCIPFYFRWVRGKFKKVVPSVFMHLASLLLIPVLIFLAPNYWGFHIIAVIGYSVYSISRRFNSEKIEDGMCSAFGGIFIFSVTSFFFLTLKMKAEMEEMVLLMMPLLGLYFICYFLVNVNTCLQLSKETVERIPHHQIVKTGIFTVGTFSLIVVGIIFLMTRFEEVSVISSFLQGLLRWFFTIFFFVVNNLDKIFREEEELARIPQPELVPGKDTTLLTEIFNHLITVLFIILVAYLLFALCREIIRFILRKRKQVVVEDLGNAQDVHEKIALKGYRETIREFFQSFTPEEKIRRYFKKSATEHVKEITGTTSVEYLKYYTARDCAGKMKNEQIAYLYEKSRYSTQECTVEDAREMKRLCKKGDKKQEE